MTAPTDTTLEAAWTEEGRRAAAALDAVHCVLVIGRDPEAAAWVALGAARSQAERRRVAVADLVGELAPLQALLPADDDPHGVSDSFLYGVSLNKIARPADEGGNLFILPSGTEAVAVEEIFRSDRWRRLASGFAEVGALLLLVAHADTPGLDALAASVDGVVVAGDAAGALPDAPPPLAVVAPRQRRAAAARPGHTATGSTAGASPLPNGSRPWLRWLTVAVLALTVAAALAYWLLPRPISRQGERRTAVGAGVSARADSARRDSVRRDSVRRDSLARAQAANDSALAAAAPLQPLVVANPGDSAAAAAYSVYVSAATSPGGAALDPGVDARSVPPVLAVTPVLDNGAPLYRLLVGAYARREQADSLLGALRRRGIVGPQSGQVTLTPYALRVADRLAAQGAAARVQALARRNVPVYTLSHGDGTVSLYAGAFELPQDAAWLARQLRAAGVAPVLVYRTGRSL